MTDFDPREARTSEWALCPRACACRVAGCEPAPVTETQERYMRRGHLFGAYVGRQFIARYGADDVELERPIRWPLGTGHADVYVRSEKLIVEVFSTTGGNIDRKIKQVKLYLYFDPEAERAAVYVVDPSTLEREDLFPVKLTEDDRAEIAAELDTLLAVQGGADPPPCVFSTPSECRFAGCSFTEAAWADWEGPELAELPEAVDIAAELFVVNHLLREAEAKVKTHRDQQRSLKEALVRAGVEPGRDYVVGPYMVRRTVVGPRSTFSLATATKAGFTLPENLLPFVKVSEGHERVTVKEAAA